MFIKEIQKKNKGYNKTYTYHRLMESYRTQRGPRSRTILELGKLDLPKEEWKLLADQIEAKITGQQSLFHVDENIENLATHYANLIIHKHLISCESKEMVSEEEDIFSEYETVDVNSLSNSRSRTIGTEYVGYSMFKELGMEKLFQGLGFSKAEIELAALSIIGRLAYPGSEYRTRLWAQHLSGIEELLGADFTHLSNNALYRILDLLMSFKDKIEEELRLNERNLFSLNEKIILYDLTNTYFEGGAKKNKKAKYSRFKEKRNDCPLVTLGLVIDEMGFPKASKIFEGNVSEPGTLKEMIEALGGEKIREVDVCDGSKKTKKGVTVVIDAGIATKKNLNLLEDEGYDYICVSRNKPIEFSEDKLNNLITIKKDKNNKVDVKLIEKEGESILYCRSLLKWEKEQSMKSLFQERFEEGMKEIKSSLSKKGGTKSYDKVLERIGRLKEKYASIAHYYKVDVKKKGNVAIDVKCRFEKEKDAQERVSGSYCLRTNRTDLREQEIWSLYMTILNVEDAFRALKSDLSLRPVCHQKEVRVEAHLFTTILAYHLLVSIQTKLRHGRIYMRWQKIRELLSSHVRITTAMRNKEGKWIYIRNCSVPEPFHKTIYNALGLSHCPIRKKRINI